MEDNIKFGSRVIFENEDGEKFLATVSYVEEHIAYLNFDDGDEGWEDINRLTLIYDEKNT
jgi:hypothetical protein